MYWISICCASLKLRLFRSHKCCVVSVIVHLVYIYLMFVWCLFGLCLCGVHLVYIHFMFVWCLFGLCLCGVDFVGSHFVFIWCVFVTSRSAEVQHEHRQHDAGDTQSATQHEQHLKDERTLQQVRHNRQPTGEPPGWSGGVLNHLY